jgi:glycosyltransferase involved in cell wall biosynthesis
MGISKQSDIIHQEVLKQNGFNVVNYDDGAVPTNVKPNQIITGYVPHGLNHKVFKPDTKSDSYKAMMKQWKTDAGVDFIVMWNNRNIRRKQPGDLILAFKHFVNQLPEEQRSKVALLMHTQPIDDNGTDLYAICKTLAPECKIVFSEQKLSATDLNALYNVADVVVNIGSNEGWGLSSTEAMLSGTPIINNVTGGLQDQCGFEDEDGNWLCFDGEFTTNHMGRFKKHGIWAKPVFPSNRSLQGSPQTPYIFDDRVNFEDVGDAMMYWYNMTEETRAVCGYEGRQWSLANGLTSEQMGNKMIEMFTYLFESKQESRSRYTLHKVEPKKYKNTGIVTK